MLTTACGRYCCKSLFALLIKNSPGCRRDFRVKMWGTSSPDDKLTGDLGTRGRHGRRSGCRRKAGKSSGQTSKVLNPRRSEYAFANGIGLGKTPVKSRPVDNSGSGRLDHSPVNPRTNVRVTSRLRLHTRERDCALRSQQVLRFAWR